MDLERIEDLQKTDSLSGKLSICNSKIVYNLVVTEAYQRNRLQCNQFADFWQIINEFVISNLGLISSSACLQMQQIFFQDLLFFLYPRFYVLYYTGIVYKSQKLFKMPAEHINYIELWKIVTYSSDFTLFSSILYRIWSDFFKNYLYLDYEILIRDLRFRFMPTSGTHLSQFMKLFACN